MHWTKTAKGKRRLAEIKEARRQKRTLSKEQKEMRGGAVSILHATTTNSNRSRRDETVTEALDRVSELLQKTNQAFDKAEKRLSEILSQIQ